MEVCTEKYPHCVYNKGQCDMFCDFYWIHKKHVEVVSQWIFSFHLIYHLILMKIRMHYYHE
jgi:hypothetical protein